MAADACARFAARRHRSGEPIATLCSNNDIPECRSDAGRGAGKRESPSQQLGLYQSIIAWAIEFRSSFLNTRHYSALKAPDRGALLLSQAQVREFVCQKQSP